MTGSLPLRHARVVLPLLSFGTGATDAFAFTAFGGIFTANMTGNAVLATIVTGPDYLSTLAGAATALVSFMSALALGFRVTRAPSGNRDTGTGTSTALRLSAACLTLLVLLWWFVPHSGAMLHGMIAASAAAMALQTVAAKRDGILRGATTTFATGTLTDLVQDLVEGVVPRRSDRWPVLVALPLGAATAVTTGMIWPDVTPVLPLAATLTSIALIGRSHARSGSVGGDLAAEPTPRA